MTVEFSSRFITHRSLDQGRESSSMRSPARRGPSLRIHHMPSRIVSDEAGRFRARGRARFRLAGRASERATRSYPCVSRISQGTMSPDLEAAVADQRDAVDVGGIGVRPADPDVVLAPAPRPSISTSSVRPTRPRLNSKAIGCWIVHDPLATRGLDLVGKLVRRAWRPACRARTSRGRRPAARTASPPRSRPSPRTRPPSRPGSRR